MKQLLQALPKKYAVMNYYKIKLIFCVGIDLLDLKVIFWLWQTYISYSHITHLNLNLFPNSASLLKGIENSRSIKTSLSCGANIAVLNNS